MYLSAFQNDSIGNYTYTSSTIDNPPETIADIRMGTSLNDGVCRESTNLAACSLHHSEIFTSLDRVRRDFSISTLLANPEASSCKTISSLYDQVVVKIKERRSKKDGDTHIGRTGSNEKVRQASSILYRSKTPIPMSVQACSTALFHASTSFHCKA